MEVRKSRIQGRIDQSIDLMKTVTVRGGDGGPMVSLPISGSLRHRALRQKENATGREGAGLRGRKSGIQGRIGRSIDLTGRRVEPGLESDNQAQSVKISGRAGLTKVEPDRKKTLELWNVLATTYSQVSEAKFLQLKRQFQDIKRGTRSVLEYIHEIKNVSDQLAIIGHPVSDKDKVQQALSELRSEFDIFCTVLEVLHVLPSFEDLKAKLIQHEANRVQRQVLVHSGSHNVLVTGAHALHGSRPRVWNSRAGIGKGILPTPNTNAQSNVTRRIPTSFYCNKKGHVKSECWHNPQNKEKQVKRDNKAARSTVSNSVAASNISPNVQQILMTALSKVNLRQNEEGQWYVDFGAAAHVTGDAGKLSSALPYLAKGSVVTGDGSHHKISHTGNAHISMAHSFIPLKNVFVVPNVKKNIIYVSKLIDDTHSSVEFTPSVYVKDARTKKTFAKDVRKGDMYVIEEAPKVSKSCVSDLSFPSHSEVNIIEYDKPSI
ncbi:hypothetical protein EJ110_NYTH13772 [Nymphaea thermarum]|nr:hypothetical protein EJ110_NYTH13772 [Nymphaea thermarum]